MNEEHKQDAIILGADENAEYVAYGDESGIDDIYLSYAFITKHYRSCVSRMFSKANE